MRMRLKKWARPELEACPFFIPFTEERKGNWHSLFAREQPLWLELGCGKGGFLKEYALTRPDVNFLGIDMISDMLGVARRQIQSAFDEAGRPVDNLLLTSYDVARLEQMMDERDVVDRIFINFCNPWDKPKQYKKRLTHPRQLMQYRALLKENGEIWFKTDDDELFRHSMLYFRECGFEESYHTENLQESGFSPNVETEHEAMYHARGISIKFTIMKKTVLDHEPDVMNPALPGLAESRVAENGQAR